MVTNNGSDLDSLNKIMRNRVLQLIWSNKYDCLLYEKQRRKALVNIKERNEITLLKQIANKITTNKIIE